MEDRRRRLVGWQFVRGSNMTKLTILLLLLSTPAFAQQTKVTRNEMVLVSSSTNLNTAHTLTNSAWQCVTGSTLTVTTTGGRVMMGLSGTYNTTTVGGVGAGWTVIIDGSPLYGATKGILFMNTESTGYKKNPAFVTLTPTALSAGVHTFCLAARVAGGAYNIIWDVTDSSGQFWVMEIP